jgi:hypothetical protein
MTQRPLPSSDQPEGQVMHEDDEAGENYHVPSASFMLIGVGVLIALHMMGFRFVFEAGTR